MCSLFLTGYIIGQRLFVLLVKVLINTQNFSIAFLAFGIAASLMFFGAIFQSRKLGYEQGLVRA